MTDHLSGLRRRSPNPNVSPLPQLDIPYSPALLSPYINVSGNTNTDGSRAGRGLGLGAGHNDPLERYHERSPLASRQDSERRDYPNPTIRLVPSSTSHLATHRYDDEARSPIQAIRHPHAYVAYGAPPASRSRSNDESSRRNADAVASLASLQRHRTDPKSYHHLSTGSRSDLTSTIREDGKDEYHLFPRDLREKPVPLLPLDIRRSRSSGPPSIISSDGRRGGGTSESGSSLPTTPRDRPNSVLSSIKSSLRNPFSQSQTSLVTPTPSSPTHSTRSLRSFVSTSSTTSSSTRSSTSTLAVPFNPATIWKAYGVEGGKAADVMIKKGGEDGLNEKLTDKFPTPGPVNRLEKGKKERWTGYKWALLLSVLTVFGYGIGGLTWALLIMFRMTMVTDPDIVVFLTLASLLCIFSSLIGLTGVLLNSRPILAFYNLLLWPTLLSMCLVGYTSYKRGSLQLDRKLNQAWSQFLDDGERLRVQNSLRCCGYFNPRHDATYSKRCYPRTTLPGCKSNWMRFERQKLHEFSTAAFGTIPFHLMNIVLALLCSNHVNRTFGKGMTPPGYRLCMADVRSNALAVLATLPQKQSHSYSRSGSKAASLAREPAISHKSRTYSPYRSSSDFRHHGSRPNSRMSTSSWESGETMTEVGARETRSRRSDWGNVLVQAGPRGRALREARDRGML
ncbi:hypothetical protein CI109_102169 [Kwoniella shandongensis]|uniref:Tetraspanin Tsp2 n=1 Tax=Kwoniella shandongensis TaxID=1734106 RepID=A0AAJ8LEM9_9TREE